MDDRRALETYISLAHRLTRATPFEGGAGELCGKLALLAGARALALFDVRPGANELVLMGAYGLPAEYVKRYPPRIARAVARMPGDVREALQRGHTVRIDGLTDDPRTVSLTGVALAARLHASVTIPLVQEGDVLGILHAFYADSPDARRLALLDGAAPLVLNALTMQRLRGRIGQGYAQVPEAEASHLFGPAHATRHLKQVHAVAERYEQRYALVVYQLDHAPKLHSTYGRPFIDLAVGRLGSYIAAECRDADLPGRLDPFSCLVLLPGTGQRGAFTQVERVLGRFGRHAFKQGDARLQLSCSAGVSCYPQNGALSADGALKSALTALDTARGKDGERIVAIAAAGAAAADAQ